MVVRTVFSIQYSVFRRNFEGSLSNKFDLRKVVFLLTFLSTEYWILNTAFARALGTHGVIYPIEEQDPILLIQQKLKGMDESGELKRRNVELQKKTRASIERPKPAQGITRAPKGHVFFYDPTYLVKEDLYDHQGHKFAQKGDRINPLETVSLSRELIFFDGDDEEQLAWVKVQLNQPKDAKPLKLILVKGMPLKLAEELGIPVYFDQRGILTKKLGITHVPAVVSQDKLQLRVEEIHLNGGDK